MCPDEALSAAVHTNAPPGLRVVCGSPGRGAAYVSRETLSSWDHACGSMPLEHPDGKGSVPCCEAFSGSRRGCQRGSPGSRVGSCGYVSRFRMSSTESSGVRGSGGPGVRPIAPEGGARRDVGCASIGSVGRGRHGAPNAGWHADRLERRGFPEAGMFHVKRCRSPAGTGPFRQGAQIASALARLPESVGTPVAAGGDRRDSPTQGGVSAIWSSRSRHAGGGACGQSHALTAEIRCLDRAIGRAGSF